jgi:hypothetical protein
MHMYLSVYTSERDLGKFRNLHGLRLVGSGTGIQGRPTVR